MKISAARKCQSWAYLQMTATVPDGLPWTPDIRNFWYLVVTFNNFATMSNCPWVQGKSKKPPPPPVVFVWGDSYSTILPPFLVSLIFMNMQMR